jgi:hypothetical protein
VDGNAPGKLRRRAAFRLRAGIQGLDEQGFSSEGFQYDVPEMDFPAVE